MKIDYIKHGDICLPALKPPEGTYEIGRFGRMYLDHIKKNRRVVYSQLMIKGTLLKHVSQIDKHARKFYDNLMKDFAKDAPPMENQMEWVGYMNNARHSAEEIVMKEFIFEE